MIDLYLEGKNEVQNSLYNLFTVKNAIIVCTHMYVHIEEDSLETGIIGSFWGE